MNQEGNFSRTINRRDLLKKASSGICLLGLTYLSGCTPGEESPEKQEAQQPKPAEEKGLINPRPSSWHSSLEENRVRCELCPEQCELEDGERALCRVRENQGGELYTLAFGNPALVQEDPVERKPFYHVIPGSRALSISTAGCNLTCKFCEVWDMALEDPEKVFAHDMPPDRVIKYAEEARVRSVSYAFGEPVIFYEYMKEVAEQAHQAGFLNLMHTAGYIQPEPLKDLITKIDAVNLDLKGFDEDFYREVVGGELKPVLDALKMIREANLHLEITNIVIPTLNDDQEKIRKMCEWIVKELGTDVPLHFARFYPLYKLSDLPRTPVSDLDKARNTALETGLEYVYVADVEDHEGENTYCPQCEATIIKRTGFVIEETQMENGACKHCGKDVPGIWGSSRNI